MALGKKKAGKETNKVEEIKAEEEVIEVEAEVVDQEEVTSDKKETTSKEVAVKKDSNAVLPPIKGGKLQFLIDEYKNAIEPIGWGVVPKITAKGGEFFDGDNNSLGKHIEFTLVSFNDSYLISTGTSDKEDRKKCRYSYDNEFLNDDSGRTVKEYIQELKDEGYDDTNVKKYHEVNVILNDADEDTEHIGNLVQLSLSPESVKQFHAYKLQSTIKAARGIIKPADVGEMKATAKNINRAEYTYTIYMFKNVHE